MNAQQRIAELEAALAASHSRLQELEQHLERMTEQNAALTEQNAALTKQVEELTELLARNSRNSHLPPSSDPPGRAGKRGKDKKRAGAKEKRRGKRGGQLGHSGAHRELVPEDQVSEFVDIFPQQCGSCWEALPRVPDPKARRYQVTEVPPLRPQITEYRRHKVTCSCGYKTRVPYAESQIPALAFGPRLMSLVALLTGVYHVSRRNAAQLLSDLVGVRISLGAVSAIEERVSSALLPAVAEAWEEVERAEVKHTDGSVPRRQAQTPKGERSKPCCMNDEGRPLGIGMQVQVSNHHELPGSRAPVVSVDGKRRGTTASGEVQEDERERTADDVSKCAYSMSKLGGAIGPGRVQKEPADWLDGIRHGGGVSLNQAFIRNVGTCRPDAKERAQAGSPCKGASTDAGHRGGATRSSDEGRETGWSQGVASFSNKRGSTGNRRNP